MDKAELKPKKKQEVKINEVLSLKSVSMENFKIHESLEIPFNKLNEIYGKNRTGKTSVHEAIKFCLSGGKGDKDKVRNGADKAKVTTKFESASGHQLTIQSEINTLGESKWAVNFDGVGVHSPKSFIKRLISFGTFNPKELLSKEGRTERLLNLLPLKIEKKDCLVPGTDKMFPIHDKESIEWDKHAVVVLKQIEKDIRNVRHSLGVKKDTLVKTFAETEEEYKNQIFDFKKLYQYEPRECKKTYKEAIEDKAKFEEGEKHKKDMYKEAEAKTRELEETIESLFGLNSSFSDQINDLQNKITSLREKKKMYESNIIDNEKELKKVKEKKETLFKGAESYNSQLLSLEKKLAECSMADKIKEKEEAVLKKKKEKEKAVEIHENMDYLVKKQFPKLQLQILEPIKSKIPNLDFNDKGEFIYQGKVIDELSESETIELALKFMNLDKKSNLIAIDGAECLDSSTVDKIEWGDHEVILIRVADKPLGKNWRSHEIK